jgi:hypothetical protein
MRCAKENAMVSYRCLLAAVALAAAGACSPTSVPILTATPPSIPVLPTDTPVPPAATIFAPVSTPGTGECEIVADGTAAIYQRPDISSGLFGTFAAGDRVPAAAYTADGWIGFEPGVAQAANVGVFRDRWVQWGEAFHLEGSCRALPLVVGPPAGICFLMIFEETPVYESPDASSAVIATLQLGDYVEAIGRRTGWFEADLGVGSANIDEQGWIAGAQANLNGPCDNLAATGP